MNDVIKHVERAMFVTICDEHGPAVYRPESSDFIKQLLTLAKLGAAADEIFRCQNQIVFCKAEYKPNCDTHCNWTTFCKLRKELQP